MSFNIVGSAENDYICMGILSELVLFIGMILDRI